MIKLNVKASQSAIIFIRVFIIIIYLNKLNFFKTNPSMRKARSFNKLKHILNDLAIIFTLAISLLGTYQERVLIASDEY
jgi:hypothetical protein